MSAYGGYIQFQNLLKEDIKTGKAYHKTSDYGEDKIVLDGLPDGGISGLVPFYTSTSNSDTWGFEVTTESGKKYKASGSEGFHNDNAGAIVILQAVAANSSNRTFNVSIPPAADNYNDWSF